MTRLVCLGAGGHATVVMDAAKAAGFEIAEVLDRDGDGRIEGLAREGAAFAIGLGGTGDNGPRRDLYERALAAGAELPPIVHPSAVVSPGAELGPGCVVLAGAIVNTGARIGADVIVNTAAVVEHDCEVGDHAHLSPRSVLGGGARVGEGAHIGIGAVVRDGAEVGAGAVLGAGAVTVTDVPAGETWAGVPARPLQ